MLVYTTEDCDTTDIERCAEVSDGVVNLDGKLASRGNYKGGGFSVIVGRRYDPVEAWDTERQRFATSDSVNTTSQTQLR